MHLFAFLSNLKDIGASGGWTLIWLSIIATCLYVVHDHRDTCDEIQQATGLKKWWKRWKLCLLWSLPIITFFSTVCSQWASEKTEKKLEDTIKGLREIQRKSDDLHKTQRLKSRAIDGDLSDYEELKRMAFGSSEVQEVESFFREYRSECQSILPRLAHHWWPGSGERIILIRNRSQSTTFAPDEIIGMLNSSSPDLRGLAADNLTTLAPMTHDRGLPSILKALRGESNLFVRARITKSLNEMLDTTLKWTNRKAKFDLLDVEDAERWRRERQFYAHDRQYHQYLIVIRNGIGDSETKLMESIGLLDSLNFDTNAIHARCLKAKCFLRLGKIELAERELKDLNSSNIGSPGAHQIAFWRGAVLLHQNRISEGWNKIHEGIQLFAPLENELLEDPVFSAFTNSYMPDIAPKHLDDRGGTVIKQP